MANNSNGPKGDYDNMNKDALAGVGLLSTLIFGAVGAATVANNKRKKDAEISQKRAELNQRLSNVRYELSKKRGNIFRESWYASEIEQLEAQEAQILRALKELD